jgi:RimJ/RimL family protein N-acetyltransferase
MKLTTNRIILFPIDLEIFKAISNGTLQPFSEYHYNEEWAGDDLKKALPMFEEFLKRNGNDGFNLWLVIEKESNLMVGSVGYVGKPNNEGEIEICFEIAPNERRKEFCLESVKTLLKWGFNHNEVNCIIARCKKNNIPSKNVIMKLGFEYFCEKDDFLIWKLEKKSTEQAFA